MNRWYKMEITHDEFIEKYANVRVHFASYYKYSFTYVGITEDKIIVSVDYGGHADYIYRVEVGANDSFLLGETSKTFRCGKASKHGETIDVFYYF
jgi:hypothetical protein